MLDVLLKAPPALLTIAGIIATLLLAFIVLFLIPAVRLRIRLSKVLGQLERMPQATTQELQSVFESDTKLRYLWKEFKDTLFAQTEERDGETVVVAYRATTLAEAFFNVQSIVDSRLRTEFFKHLPGIFTGIGIIGTFLGLIHGLQQFQVSEDAGQVRRSLELLLAGVFEAFMVSAAAIALAMFATILEKSFLASLYRLTEAIAHHLDGLFKAGAGEEYLARLVDASEDSASQSKILKDSLVGDLKSILQEITDRQIAANATATKELASTITGGIETSLRDPLERIGNLVSEASGDQSAAAAELLKDVMASFSQRLNELFGGQISGIQELNQRSAQTMQDAVSSLNQLVQRLEDGSQRSGDAMADKMAKAVEDMERRQAEMNEQARAMVESIRDMVTSAQSETSSKLTQTMGELSAKVADMVGALQNQAALSQSEQQRREDGLAVRTNSMVEALSVSVTGAVQQMMAATSQIQDSVATSQRAAVGELGAQVTDMVGTLRTQLAQAHAEQQQREDQLALRTNGMVTTLGESISQVVEHMVKSTSQMQQSVAALQRTTTESIDKLNTGAATLERGAAAFAQAGEKVTGTLGQAAEVSKQLGDVSGTLSSSATALQSVLADYRANRDATSSMLAEVRVVVESAKREAAMTDQVLGRIQDAATKLVAAQEEVEDYLQGVSEVLGQAQASFLDGLMRTVDRTNSNFHEKLSAAVSLLSASIEELDASLAGIGARA